MINAQLFFERFAKSENVQDLLSWLSAECDVNYVSIKHIDIDVVDDQWARIVVAGRTNNYCCKINMISGDIKPLDMDTAR